MVVDVINGKARKRGEISWLELAHKEEDKGT